LWDEREAEKREVMVPRKVLILAGTAEARELAALLAERPDWRTVSSFAGRTAAPKLPVGEVRTGGFGGAAPLARFLADERIAAIIDASHPFAERISRNALAVAKTANMPLLRVSRPPWTQQEGDQWHEIGDWQEAVPLLKGLSARVFLAIGHQELRAFSGIDDSFFLVRTVDPAPAPLPLQHYEAITGRGPFALEDEMTLLRERAISHVICKNSGGSSAYGKLEAARILKLPVIIKQRPQGVRTPAVSTVEDAVAWLETVAA
jgi:precorrin-6A/cobalt-precorrin-6A reductase